MHTHNYTVFPPNVNGLNCCNHSSYLIPHVELASFIDQLNIGAFSTKMCISACPRFDADAQTAIVEHKQEVVTVFCSFIADDPE